MAELTCVPVLLYPLPRLRFHRCTVVPGVALVPFQGRLKTLINDVVRRLPVQTGFSPSHIICVDHTKYLRAVAERWQADRSVPPPDPRVDADGIARQVLISLVLVGRIHFTYGGRHQLTTTPRKPGSYQVSAYVHAPTEAIPANTGVALTHGVTSSVAARSVQALAARVDRYFRSGVWCTDRLAAGLKHFWNGLLTPFPEQTLISLTTSLEAVLGTEAGGITHTLAERVAILLARSGDSPISKYRTIKKLYGVRSKVVHGRVTSSRGVQNYESLFNSAKQSNVPISTLGLLTAIVVQVFNTVLASEPELLAVIQRRESEQRISEAVDAFFESRLLRR